MVRRVLLLVVLLLGQSVVAAVPMACAAPLQDAPCHGEALEAPEPDPGCEIRCTTGAPAMPSVPGVQVAPVSGGPHVLPLMPLFELPPVEEIFHPPISL